MKLFKRIMLAVLSLCMTLGIVAFVASCGVQKTDKDVEYTVTVTCAETDVLANVKAGLTTAAGDAVEGGEARSLLDGKATFTAEAGTYKVVLTGVPETYEWNTGATVSEAAPAVTIALTKKAVEPPKVTLDAKYNGTWSNKDHTLVVDAANGTITLDDIAATDITAAEDGGYTFKCGEKTWSLYFTTETNELCLDDGEDDFSALKAGTYTPPAPATMPADFPTKWYDGDGAEAIVFTGANFTYSDETGVVTAVTDNKDGTYTLTATYSDAEISFTWTEADYTLSMTVFDTPLTYYAEGHVPLQIALVYEGTWTSQDGTTTIVIDTDNNTITISEDPATDIAAAADGNGYTFTWSDETCSVYFLDDDFTTLYFKFGDMDPVAFTQKTSSIMPEDFPAEWYDETGEVALTFDGDTFPYMDGEGVVTQGQERGGDWYFMGTYTAEDGSTHDFTLTWTKADGTLVLAVLDEDGEELMSETYYAEPQGGDVGGDDVDITDDYNGTFQDGEKAYTVVVDATNDTITINNVEVTNLKEADFGYEFDWGGKSWNLWGLAGTYFLDGTGDNTDSFTLYLVEEDQPQVDVTEEFDGKWYDEKYFTEGPDASEIVLEVNADNDTISIDGSSVKDLAKDETSGGYTFTYDNAQYKLYFSGDDRTTLYLAKGDTTPTALHKQGWTQETGVTMPADFPANWETSEHDKTLVFDGTAFTFTDSSAPENVHTYNGTITAVTDNKDGTFTLEGTCNETTATFTYGGDNKTLRAICGNLFNTTFQVQNTTKIDAAFAGTWSNKDYTIVVDTEKNIISITSMDDTVEATDIKAIDNGYSFSWYGSPCSLYFAESDSAHETITFEDGGDIYVLQKGEFVPPEIELPAGMPLKWELDMGGGAMASFILDEKGHFTGDLGDGFFTNKEEKDDGNWYFDAEVSGGDAPYIIVWETGKNLLHVTSNGDFVPSDENTVYTFSPVKELPLPAGLEGTYYDCTDMRETLTIKGTTVTLSDSEGEAYLEYTITECTDDGKLTLSTETEGDNPGETMTVTVLCAFDLEAGTFSYYVDPDSGEAFLVYYKTLPHADSYPEGFTTYAWSSSDYGFELLLTFEKDSCDFTYNGKEGYLYLVEDDCLYAICDGDLLYFEWVSADNTLTLDPEGYFPTEFHPVKAEFDPTAFLALELDGMWYADAYVGALSQLPIYLNFTKDTTTVKFALDGQFYAQGEVTAYDAVTHTITAEVGGTTYFFVYDPTTTRITDGNPEGADSTVNYGPYIHYENDFDATKAPDWYSYTFVSTDGLTLTFSDKKVLLGGNQAGTIRHYDAETKQLIMLSDGRHYFLTYDGNSMLTQTALKGDDTETYTKAPDPVDPKLDWLTEYAWKAENGNTVSFDGANITLHVGAEWKGYFTAHNADTKTLTAFFIGHGNVTFTYNDASPKTLTAKGTGVDVTFTQEIPLTLPEKLNGTTWTPDTKGNFDANSITFGEDGKLTIDTNGNLKGTYDITVTSHDEDTKTWNFEISVVGGKKEFVYVEEPETLTVDIGDRWNESKFTKKTTDVGGDTSQLPAGLQNTTWNGVNSADKHLNVAFDETLTMKYIDSDATATPTKTAEITNLQSQDGVWTFSMTIGSDWMAKTYNFTYNEANGTLTAVQSNVASNIYTFTKAEA